MEHVVQRFRVRDPKPVLLTPGNISDNEGGQAICHKHTVNGALIWTTLP